MKILNTLPILFFCLVTFIFQKCFGWKEEQILVTEYTGSFEFSHEHCKSLNLDLIRIKNEADNNLIYNLVKSSNKGSYWIDGRFESNKEWKYLDGIPMIYKEKSINEPSFCIQGNTGDKEFWSYKECTNIAHVICYAKKIVLHSENVLNIKRVTDFNFAKFLCNRYGLKLINVTNYIEHLLIIDIVKKTYWRDKKIFKFVTLKDNSSWVRPYPAIFPLCTAGGFRHEFYWGYDNCNKLHNVVCYLKKNVLTASQLFVPQKQMIFYDSVKFCERSNQTLVPIDNEIDNNFLYAYAKLHNVGWYWIDVRFNGRQWVHSNNKRTTFTKWGGTFGTMFLVKECVIGTFWKFPNWFAQSCEFKLICVICYKEK